MVSGAVSDKLADRGRRYVQWAINMYRPDWYTVVRREMGEVVLISTAATMCDAEIACCVDRARVLADPRVIEISSPERNVR